MKIRQYETSKYPGIKFFVDEEKKLFAVMGSNRDLHESGLLPEEDYQKLMTESHLPYGVIFAADKTHLFEVQNLTKGKILVDQMKFIIENNSEVRA